MALTLVIGNKNYSSWSFRPWIALRTAAIPFEEVGSHSMSRAARSASSRSRRRQVPVLVDGDVRV